MPGEIAIAPVPVNDSFLVAPSMGSPSSAAIYLFRDLSLLNVPVLMSDFARESSGPSDALGVEPVRLFKSSPASRAGLTSALATGMKECFLSDHLNHIKI